MASYEHAHALVRAHGEAGRTGRPVPLTTDGLIYVTSIVMLDSARRKVPVRALARWLLGPGIAATLAANVAHGLGDGLAGATVAAWPTVALAGSYELSLGVLELLRDVALERFTESFCNISATCGACCRRRSERCRWRAPAKYGRSARPLQPERESPIRSEHRAREC